MLAFVKPIYVPHRSRTVPPFKTTSQYRHINKHPLIYMSHIYARTRHSKSHSLEISSEHDMKCSVFSEHIDGKCFLQTDSIRSDSHVIYLSTTVQIWDNLYFTFNHVGEWVVVKMQICCSFKINNRFRVSKLLFRTQYHFVNWECICQSCCESKSSGVKKK